MDNLTNVTTGEVRFSYAHLFKPYAAMPGQEERFGVTVLVPKSDADTMGRIHTAIEAAKQRGISDKWNGACPPMVPTPVYDGDGVRPSDGMPFGPECKGHWMFTASANADYPPEVVDKMGNPIMNQSDIYSGMYGRVNVTFFPYAFGAKKGIGCGLGPVQKLRDGCSRAKFLSNFFKTNVKIFREIVPGFSKSKEGRCDHSSHLPSFGFWFPCSSTIRCFPVLGILLGIYSINSSTEQFKTSHTRSICSTFKLTVIS